MRWVRNLWKKPESNYIKPQNKMSLAYLNIYYFSGVIINY